MQASDVTVFRVRLLAYWGGPSVVLVRGAGFIAVEGAG